MLRRCFMSQVRRLATAASRETNLKSLTSSAQTTTKYRSHMIPPPPLTPLSQLLVFRSLSTASPPNKGKEDSAAETTTDNSFVVWMKSIFEHPVFVTREERIEAGYLKYRVSGFMGARKYSIKAQLTNSRELVVSGFTFKSNGSTSDIRRHITLPNYDYSEANMKATFYPNLGIVVVEISDYKKHQDVDIQVKQTKED